MKPTLAVKPCGYHTDSSRCRHHYPSSELTHDSSSSGSHSAAIAKPLSTLT